jgi:hypothetical protein
MGKVLASLLALV